MVELVIKIRKEQLEEKKKIQLLKKNENGRIGYQNKKGVLNELRRKNYRGTEGYRGIR